MTVKRVRQVSVARDEGDLCTECLGMGLLPSQPQSRENHTEEEDLLLGGMSLGMQNRKYHLFSLGKLERITE